MRPNRYVILVSVLFGALGVWFSGQAVAQYLDMVRSFAGVEFDYVEDTFVWQDPQHERAKAEFLIRNDSDNAVVIGYVGLNLYFDGEFAGARYQTWEPVVVQPDEEVIVEVPFLTSIKRMRPAGSDAELSVRGEVRLEFEGIQRDMTVRVGETIGRVPYEES